MKISRLIVVLPTLMVGAFLYIFSENDDRQVRIFIKDKYAMDIIIKNKGFISGFPSDQKYIVYQVRPILLRKFQIIHYNKRVMSTTTILFFKGNFLWSLQSS